MADAAAGKKVFDIAKPGKSAPSSNSRPVIIGHKTLVEDPMVAKNAPAVEPPKKAAPKTANIVSETTEAPAPTTASPTPNAAVPSKRITIMPLSHDDEETKPGPKPAVKADTPLDSDISQKITIPDEPATAEPEASTPESTKDTEPEPTEEPAESTNIPETSDTAAMDAVLEQAGNNKKNKDAAEDKIKQDAVDKLVASKQYFLPIDEAKHIHAVEKFLATAFLVALVALAGAYLAVDAGLIKANVNLPIDLIKN